MNIDQVNDLMRKTVADAERGMIDVQKFEIALDGFLAATETQCAQMMTSIRAEVSKQEADAVEQVLRASLERMALEADEKKAAIRCAIKGQN